MKPANAGSSSGIAGPDGGVASGETASSFDQAPITETTLLCGDYDRWTSYMLARRGGCEVLR